MSKKKTARLACIKQAVQTNEFSRHEDLLEYLKQHGHKTTQATLSRDLAELGIVRVSTPNGFRYRQVSTTNTSSNLKTVRMLIREIAFNQAQVMIKAPGGGNLVKRYIEDLNHPDICLVIADADDVLVIPYDVRTTPSICRYMKIRFQE